MIDTIEFKSYKSYKEWQKFEIKPLTILFGKNSSGKSAIAKLPTMLEESLKGSLKEPIQLNNNGVELGADFRDLLYGRIGTEVLEFKLTSGDEQLYVKIASNIGSENTPKILSWKLNDDIDLTYDYHNNTYHNSIDSEEYLCEFNGFLLDVMLYKNKDGSGTTYNLSKIKIKTSYFGPFREIPEPSYTVSQFQKIYRFGIKGENAYYFLIKDSETYDKTLLKNVSNWYQENFDGWKIAVQKDIQRPNYYIELTKENSKLDINIRNVGQGMSQVLPLIVRAFYPADEPTLIIIEQPELHLHSGVHGNLAELFANTLADKNKHYLIETHSKNFILRIRRLIAEGKFNKDDLALYLVNFDEENNTSSLSKIDVMNNGKVDNWPYRIFDDTLDETIALRTAQKLNE